MGEGKKDAEQQYFDPDSQAFIHDGDLYSTDGTVVRSQDIKKIEGPTDEELQDIGRTIAPFVRDLPRLRAEIQRRVSAAGPKERFEFEYECPIPPDARFSDERISILLNIGVALMLINPDDPSGSLMELASRHGYQIVPKVRLSDSTSCTVTLYVKPNPIRN